MYPMAPLKADLVLQTTSVTNGGTATAQIDCLGFDFLNLDVISTTSDNATNNPSVLKLSESDTTDATNYSDITAFVGDGVGGFTVPNWFTSTSNAKVVKFCVDLRHRKRYLKLTVSPLTTQSFTALANLGRGEVAPVIAADANSLALVAG